MEVSIDAIKKVRNITSVGLVQCKDALLEADGNMEEAIRLLQRRGIAIAGRKAERVTTEGVIEAYIHHTGHIGALVEVNCETDFVARTTEFRELAHDLAMQVAAASPQFVTPEEMPAEVGLEPQAVCLLLQPFIKEPGKTVQQVITEMIAKVGENIKVRKFARFELGY